MGFLGERVASRGVCDGLPGGMPFPGGVAGDGREDGGVGGDGRDVAPLLSVTARVEAILPTLAQGPGAFSREAAARRIDKRSWLAQLLIES